VTWPLNGSEARVDLAWIQTPLLLSCKCTKLASEQLVLHNKSSEVCIKTWSTLASLPCKGQVTEQTTVKWSIYCSCVPVMIVIVCLLVCLFRFQVMLCFTVLSLLFSWILCDARTSRWGHCTVVHVWIGGSLNILKISKVLKGAMLRFPHLEKLHLTVSSSWFIIRVYFLHP